jgi:hypothetical protein
MKRFLLTSGLGLSVVLFATTASAHHSFAMFDRGQTQKLTGTVKQVELINPHGWLRISVADRTGAQNEWSLEMGPARATSNSDWMQLHPGDKVDVQIHPLKDGSYGGQLMSVTLPNGQVLSERR